eukprot:TRINITY_DN312_c0_g2_i1.p2 TRINITY_DN312_c0_g2~~TRINITY_DN312_c0_g2_i1.p2  ORF type:complete len:76 (+),score=11.22 TRINITY_DN312_c0_g2_i1:101-328(+)
MSPEYDAKTAFSMNEHGRRPQAAVKAASSTSRRVASVRSAYIHVWKIHHTHRWHHEALQAAFMTQQRNNSRQKHS